MTFKLLHCWDCGAQVITGERGQYTFLPLYRQVKFGLADGSYCESPFCQECAEREWTWTRTKEFEAAVNRVHPSHQIHVVSVEGRTLSNGPILAILEPTHTVQGNTG